MVKASRYRAEIDAYGLHLPYLNGAKFEDEEEYDFSLTAHYDSDDSDKDLYNDPATLQTLKKYVQQIRDSDGFDVDCRPPSWFEGPFWPVNLTVVEKRSRNYDLAMEAAEFAIREINSEMSGKRYKFVELNKAVLMINFFFLLTITSKEEEEVVEDVDTTVKEEEEFVEDVDTTVKEEEEVVGNTKAEAAADVVVNDAGGVARTIQAVVYYHFADGFDFEQWRFKSAAAEDA